jgi:hypothetical protein
MACSAKETPVPELHVVPVGRTGTWRVHDGDPSAPLSEHMSEDAAEFAALIRARARGAERVVVHDCYHRTRELAPLGKPAGSDEPQRATAG